ncbi:MAG: ATP-binding protein [Methanospirillum sp.]
MSSVLYYDRDPVWREAAARWLARPGEVEVVTASTFDEAVTLFRQQAFDVVVAVPLEDEVLGLLSFVHPHEKAVPFVLLMEPGHEAVVIKALNSGAARYIEKSGDPAERLGSLVGTIGPMVYREQESAALQRRTEELEFLSRTAMDFVRMDEDVNIYRYIAEKVSGLVPECYVAVMLLDRDTRLFTVQSLLPEPAARITEEEVGRDLVGMSFPLDRVPSAEAVLGCDRLVEVVTSLYQGLFMTLPKDVCERIEERVDAGKFHTMGFNCREGLYGTLTIVVRKGGELAHRELIEAFVRQASVALLRQHVRARLRESDARYRAVVESQQELICRFCPDGTHLVANEAYCRFFGLDPGGLPGIRFVPKIPTPDRAALAGHFRAFSPSSSEGTAEHRVVRVDGAVRWLQWHDRAFFDGDGALVEFQSVGRDVTERREAEEALAALTAELERRVEERTVELQTANRDLEAANRDLEAFSYQVSHDLRAPLRAIDGYLGILMLQYGGELPVDAVALVGRARGGVSRANRFIEGLLSLSRLSRRPLALERVATEELVRAVVGELLSIPNGRTVEVAIGPLPPCRADPEMLRHVYQNLLSNAFKFTRNRNDARVEILARSDDGETVFSVADNGVGFPPEDAARVFGDFARLHSDRQFEGSGIGLALVKRIVERHGGRCWAEGEVDKGATVSFTLGA